MASAAAVPQPAGSATVPGTQPRSSIPGTNSPLRRPIDNEDAFAFGAPQIISTNQPDLITTQQFQSGFEFFLLNFTSGGDEISYRDQIRRLSLNPFAEASLGNADKPSHDDVEGIGGSSLTAPTVVIRLDHLRMTHWLPGEESAAQPPAGRPPRTSTGGMSPRSVGTEDLSELRRNCEGLFKALTVLPLKYLQAAEYVVRDVFVLLERATRSGLPVPGREGTGSTSETELPANLIEAAKHQGVAKLLEKIEGAKALKLSLAPFQVELVYRENPQRIRDLSAGQIERLVVLSGIVVQTSRPSLKASTLHLRCQKCGHRQVMRLPHWRQGVTLPRNCDGKKDEARANPQAGQAGADNKCPLDPFCVVGEDSQYIDVQTVKIQELPDEVPTGDMPRHLALNVTCGMVGRLVAGTRVMVCGVYSAFDRGSNAGGGGNKSGSKAGGAEDKAIRAGYLHVLGMECIDKHLVSGMKGSISRSLVLTTGMGFSSQQTDQFHRLAALPDIMDQITASIAPSIFGLEDVKRSVACMLFGGSRKCLPDGTALRGDIHLLLLGDPSTAKSQVLKFVERAAPIAVYTSGKGSSAAGLTAALVKDPHGNYALEGGAMVLADGGVVCIDEFDKMRDDDRVAIHESMEQQTISIAKAGINTVLTTQCAVIAAANPTFGCYDDTKDTSEQHNFEATILSRFDCIWLVRDERNIEKDRILASHIFNLYTSNKGGGANQHLGEGPIPLDLLRGYISYCKAHCQPRLSLEAAKALENFYVEVRETCRHDRSRHNRNQIPITLRQLESLARLAEAFAKMSLSSQATMNHVEEAIRLFRVSTVATAQSSGLNHTLTAEDRDAVRNCEEAVLQRLAIGSRTAKTTIVRDMRLRGFEPPIIAKALVVLVQKGTLEERGDATVRRIAS